MKTAPEAESIPSISCEEGYIYRKTNARNLLTHDMLAIELDIPEADPVFYFEGIDVEDYDDEVILKPGVDFDSDTGENYE